MKPLYQQIREADKFYAICLNQNSKSHTTRYLVYACKNNELNKLWPSDSHLPKSKELVPGMIYSKAKQYPAYHWCLNGCGYSKLGEIRDTLKILRKGKETILELLGNE